MESNVEQRVLTVVSDILNRHTDEISLNTSLRENPELDSLKRMALFIALEDEFQRTIPPEEVMELDSVTDIVDFIYRKLKEPSSE